MSSRATFSSTCTKCGLGKCAFFVNSHVSICQCPYNDQNHTYTKLDNTPNSTRFPRFGNVVCSGNTYSAPSCAGRSCRQEMSSGLADHGHASPC